MTKFSKEALEQELKRESHVDTRRKEGTKLMAILITVAAVAVLISTLLISCFQVYGDSMNPTLQEGDIVTALKVLPPKQGNLVAFYYNNKVLVKRVIGTSGDWINMDEEGVVYVNDKKLEEPYLNETDFGECNISLPYQVPEGKIFVMGDNRKTSIDSRTSSIGAISNEQVIGTILFRAWPINRIGLPN